MELHDDLLANINFKRIRQIVCVGRVGVTSALLHHVAQAGIELAWLYDDGRFAARLAPLSGGDPQLRIAQYQLATNATHSLKIALRFVIGKITNMRVGLLRAARARHLDFADRQDRLAAARAAAGETENLAALMGCEGAATRDYFGGLSATLGSQWGFASR